MILAKSCHDLDAIPWLDNRECPQISPFGWLMHFRPENAPDGAPDRCTDGCPVADRCPFNALSIYSGPATEWPVSVVTADISVDVPGGHPSGGDDGLMRAFLHQMRTREAGANLSPARLSAETHLLAFAAEASRQTGHTIDFPAFVQSIMRR